MPKGRWARLIQGPEGAPNFCFGLYRGGVCLEFAQSDWEYPALAGMFGWVPCPECGDTDGTVDCEHRTVDEMLAGAFDYLEARDGRWCRVGN